MSFQKYTDEDFKKLLKAIDSHLTKKAELILIGGAAALLAYKATRLTQDIDSFNNIKALEKAYEEAKKETGLDIPMSQAGVAEAPYNFEDRLVSYDLKLKNLIVKVPEIHDFILMKTVRGYEHDLEVIEQISKKNEIDKSILIERFEKEMNEAVGNKRALQLNFAAVLERCFDIETGKNWLNRNKV